MENRLVKIGEAAKLLGITVLTLRRWEATGELVPAQAPATMLVSDLLGLGDADALTICYARVSSHDQKEAWSGSIRF